MGKNLWRTYFTSMFSNYAFFLLSTMFGRFSSVIFLVFSFWTHFHWFCLIVVFLRTFSYIFRNFRNVFFSSSSIFFLFSYIYIYISYRMISLYLLVRWERIPGLKFTKLVFQLLRTKAKNRTMSLFPKGRCKGRPFTQRTKNKNNKKK